MVDTLNVVTNSLPDTLRIVLSTSDKTDFWNQYSPLLVAVIVVIVSSTIQLSIASKQRKIEEKKIKADLIMKEKQKWLKDFTEIIYDLLRFITGLLLKQDSSKTFYKSTEIIHKLWCFFNLLELHLNNDIQEHKNLLLELHMFIKPSKIIKEDALNTLYGVLKNKSKDIIKLTLKEIGEM
jgi:hypothetical protein